MSANYDRAASFMRDLGDTIAQEVRRQLGMPDERATAFGMDCAQRACDEFAGQLIYVPLGLAIKIEARDREMYDAYVAAGRDINAVAKRFECSVQTAYRRIRIIELAEFNERQGGLFGDDE